MRGGVEEKQSLNSIEEPIAALVSIKCCLVLCAEITDVSASHGACESLTVVGHERDYIKTTAIFALNRHVMVVDSLGAGLEHDGAGGACLNNDIQVHHLIRALIIIVSPDQSEVVGLFGWLTA